MNENDPPAGGRSLLVPASVAIAVAFLIGVGLYLAASGDDDDDTLSGASTSLIDSTEPTTAPQQPGTTNPQSATSPTTPPPTSSLTSTSSTTEPPSVTTVPPPPDGDADGVPDDEDECPTEPGTADELGCPAPIPTVVAQDVRLVRENEGDASCTIEVTLYNNGPGVASDVVVAVSVENLRGAGAPDHVTDSATLELSGELAPNADAAVRQLLGIPMEDGDVWLFEGTVTVHDVITYPFESPSGVPIPCEE